MTNHLLLQMNQRQQRWGLQHNRLRMRWWLIDERWGAEVVARHRILVTFAPGPKTLFEAMALLDEPDALGRHKDYILGHFSRIFDDFVRRGVLAPL